MSMSRRDLYAMGEPFGDSATQHKVGGGRIYGGGGGGGGGNQISTSVVDVPEWAKPYAKKGLGQAAALTDISQNPYQTYDGERQADFTDLQNQAFTGAANATPSAAMGTAANMAGTAGLGALNAGANFNPYQTGQFTGQTAQDYMNPYMQNVVNSQQREAQRTADIASTGRNAQAVKSGAFGGSRQAIMDAEANRNLSTQMGDIQAQGLNQAYNQAQQQFNQEQQLGEQSKQYGAGLGMQGFQTALTGAGQLANIGQQTFGQEMDINKLQNQYGTQQQAFDQQGMDTQYQDFLNQQRYPYQQLEFMNSMLRGTPMGTVSSMYQPAPSQVSQIAGLGATAYGMSRMAEGGEVQGYASGGIAGLNPMELDAATNSMSDAQMQTSMGLASITDLAKLQIAQKLAQNGQIRQAAQQAEASTQQQPQSTITEEALSEMGVGGLDVPEDTFSAAGGGIVAFADGGPYENRTAGRLASSQKDSETNLERIRAAEAAAAAQASMIPGAKSDTVLPSSPTTSMAGIGALMNPQSIQDDRAKAATMDESAAQGDVITAQQQEQKYVEDQAALGERGTEREAGLREQQDELKGKEDKNFNMAIIEAGLAMMSGNSANAFENIGKGALVGTKAFKDGQEKLQARKDKLDEAIFALEDARFSDKKVDAATKRGLAKDVATAKTGVQKVLAKNYRDANVDVPASVQAETVKIYAAQQLANSNNAAAMSRTMAGKPALDAESGAIIAEGNRVAKMPEGPNKVAAQEALTAREAQLSRVSAAQYTGGASVDQRAADSLNRNALKDGAVVQASLGLMGKKEGTPEYAKALKAYEDAFAAAKLRLGGTGGGSGVNSNTPPPLQPGFVPDQ